MFMPYKQVLFYNPCKTKMFRGIQELFGKFAEFYVE